MTTNIMDFMTGLVRPPTVRVWTEAGTYIPFRDEWALIIVVGAGGSGGLVYQAGLTTFCGAMGGSAGGCVYALRRLSQGVTYSIAIGSGGAGRSENSSNVALTGNAGTSSTFSGTGLTTIEAYGGQGGLTRKINPDTVGSTYHRTPQRRSGTGGDYHFNGGSGGHWLYTVGDTGNQPGITTGGGGVNVMGMPDGTCDGGYGVSTSQTGFGNGDIQRFGGGGVGGNGGTSTSWTLGRSFGGGGAGGDGENSAPTAGPGMLYGDDMPIYLPTGAGGASGSTGGTGGNGGGGGAHSGTIGGAGGQGGLFGGGGAGGIYNTLNEQDFDAGNGGRGGGGGGAVLMNQTINAEITSGDGGDGIAFLYVLGYYTG